MVFRLSTFELCIGVRKQIKTCPGGQVLKLWLREMDLFRFASLAADFCFWQTGAFQSPNPCTEPPCLGGSNPTQHTYLTKKHPQGMSFVKSWLREMDLNHRPSGYEPDELPGCSIPR